MGELVEQNNTALSVKSEHASANEIRANVNLIQEVMRSVMRPDVHYGILPGCKTPSLYKPGAEKIMSTFRLAADPFVEDLCTDDSARFRVTVRLTSSTGAFVGAGIGECSSDEDKYRWRACYIQEEFDDTPEDRRRYKWSQYKGKPATKAKQVRTNPADLRNTVLKMAKKRAQVDAVLTATAASDIFTQDIEDLPKEYTQEMAESRPSGVKSQDCTADNDLLKSLEDAAKKGWTELQSVWKALTDTQRQQVGSKFGEFKKMAEQ